MADAPQSPPLQPTSHVELYNNFYAQALRIVAAPESNDDDELNRKIIITLDTLTKLIFGCDATIKAKLVLHGAGALELIMGLVQKPSVVKSDAKTLQAIQMSALKAVKTCVLRNPAGRSRCRSAQVYKFIGKVLEEQEVAGTKKKPSPNASLTEEAFTTLAATCLGDDLNALEASVIFRPFIKKAKEHFSDVSSMQQKILYLETLFAAVEKEQEKLLQKGKKDGLGMDSFFKNVVECESNIRTGYSHLQDAKYSMSFKHYNHAMNLILPYVEYTSLLDPLILEIRTRRAYAALEAAKYEDCVQDTCILLEGKDVRSEETRAQLLQLKGQALIKMGRHDEGKETLAKWKILCPQGGNDEEIEMLLKTTLQISE
jgi:hypothetical protein